MYSSIILYFQKVSGVRKEHIFWKNGQNQLSKGQDDFHVGQTANTGFYTSYNALTDWQPSLEPQKTLYNYSIRQ